MLWPRTGLTHYQAQLGLPDIGCAIKGLFNGILKIILGYLERLINNLPLEAVTIKASESSPFQVVLFIPGFPLQGLIGNIIQSYIINVIRQYVR